jgi:hypothetical protein
MRNGSKAHVTAVHLASAQRLPDGYYPVVLLLASKLETKYL